jgi:23S rRNA (cytosine1962-C5)-methyltransferase
VLDPPSYSKTKKTRFSSESDYGDLVAEVVALLGPGGRLLACSNHRGIGRGKFRKFVRAGAEKAGREVAQLKDLPDPSDYPPPLGRECHLKSCILTVRK